jgi:hypothetical protein
LEHIIKKTIHNKKKEKKRAFIYSERAKQETWENQRWELGEVSFPAAVQIGGCNQSRDAHPSVQNGLRVIQLLSKYFYINCLALTFP